MLSHIILGGRGIGRGVHEKLIMLFVSCLYRMSNLLTFFIKLCWNYVKSHSPDLKMVLIFLVTKVFQKGTKFR